MPQKKRKLAPRRSKTAQRLREAEILLQRIQDAGLGRPVKRRKPDTQLAILIDGNDVTVVRPQTSHRAKRSHRSDTDGSYAYGYAYGYGYEYGYGYGYGYGYERNSYEDGYDYEDAYGYGYGYGYHNEISSYGNHRKRRRASETVLTVTVQIQSDGQVRVFKGQEAERRAKRAARWLQR